MFHVHAHPNTPFLSILLASVLFPLTLIINPELPNLSYSGFLEPSEGVIKGEGDGDAELDWRRTWIGWVRRPARLDLHVLLPFDVAMMAPTPLPNNSVTEYLINII